MFFETSSWYVKIPVKKYFIYVTVRLSLSFIQDVKEKCIPCSNKSFCHSNEGTDRPQRIHLPKKTGNQNKMILHHLRNERLAFKDCISFLAHEESNGLSLSEHCKSAFRKHELDYF